MIRPARGDDLIALQDVERAAGELFRLVGMDAVADDEPLPLADLAAYQLDGRAWVATDGEDRPVAYLLVDVVDGGAHIEQVSVHPAHARQGLGRDLIDAAAGWAARHGLPCLTLTTFAEVRWNAPYYQRLGFRLVPEDQATSGLRQIRRHEEAAGLAKWPRVTMRRPVGLSE